MTTDTIRCYATEHGKVLMGDKLGSLFSKKLNTAAGDRRRKEVKQAREDLDQLTKGLNQLQQWHFKITGKKDLDLRE